MTDDQFIDKLKESIENDYPLSFSRFGDGEIFFINNNIPPRVIENYLRLTYKYSDVEVGKRDVLSIINKALSETDIIGIMNRHNSISKKISYNSKFWSINYKYVSDLRKGRELIVADQMITRGVVLGNINNFKNILRGKPIAIISPHARRLKQNNIQRLLGVDVNFIESSMGMNLNDRKNMFLKFDKIKEPIVLYGCSLMGKDFAVHLKERGKIALDFGATLDAWAGLQTKKWFKKGGLQNHCLIENGNGL